MPKATNEQVVPVTPTVQVMSSHEIAHLGKGLVVDYIHSLKSIMATESAQKRPRQWIIEGCMSDGIRNLKQASVMLNHTGVAVQPGPFDYANQQLQAQPSNDTTIGFEQILNRLDELGNRLVALEQK